MQKCYIVRKTTLAKSVTYLVSDTLNMYSIIMHSDGNLKLCITWPYELMTVKPKLLKLGLLKEKNGHCPATEHVIILRIYCWEAGVLFQTVPTVRPPVTLCMAVWRTVQLAKNSQLSVKKVIPGHAMTESDVNSNYRFGCHNTITTIINSFIKLRQAILLQFAITSHSR